jgi:hypothetical protein
VSPGLERRLLQAAFALAAIVPVSAGLLGALGRWQPDSHARYLSGLLLGIGLAFWWMVPTIERRGAVVRVLAAIVVIGGLARLAGLPETGLKVSVVLPLVMELGITPLLALWRERVQRRIDSSAEDR